MHLNRSSHRENNNNNINNIEGNSGNININSGGGGNQDNNNNNLSVHNNNLNNNFNNNQNSFFNDQLTSFEVWLSSGRNQKIGVGQLPILLQVLLSQSYRKRALHLLAKFLDLGQWAVNKALSVGIYPYILRLLKSPVPELRSVLVFIWAKVLAFERDCQINLTKDNSYLYFINVLSSPTVDQEQYSLSAFALSVIQSNFKKAKSACHRSNILQICLSRLEDEDSNVRKWICFCLAKYWEDFDIGKNAAFKENADKILIQLLNDNIPEIRATAVYALSTFLSGSKDNSNQENSERINSEMKISLTLINTSSDISYLVRYECLLAIIKMIVLYYEKIKRIVKKTANYQFHKKLFFNENNNQNNTNNKISKTLKEKNNSSNKKNKKK